jgi:D-amino-acid dehydrogenase
MEVIVVGAGVIGLTTAWELQQRGVEVTIVEERPEVAAGSSGDNGAQLSYSYVAPFAQPGLPSMLPGLLLSRNAPLRFHPRLSVELWRWSLQFLGHCRADHARRATVALLALAACSRAALHELLQRQPIEMNYTRAGKLVLHRNAAAFAHAQEQVALQAELGCIQEVLSARQCAALEPALDSGGLVGGIYTASDESGDCRRFCEQLAQALEARGVRIVTGVGAVEPKFAQGRVVGVRSARFERDATAVVLAAGTGSVEFARQAGLRLPILPHKGYSITLPMPATAGLQRNVTDYAARVVFAALGDELRVAGFVEIGARDTHPETGAIRHLMRCAQRLLPRLPLPRDAGSVRSWAGLRPASPSGLPMIGRGPRPGLWINAGHGTLGWTLACGSARLLAQQMCGETVSLDSTAFARLH